MRLMVDVPLAIRDRMLHRVEAARELAELVRRAHRDVLGVYALAHAPRGRDQELHGPRDGVREPERAADRECKREARDEQQDVADRAVRLRRFFHRALQRDVHVARVVQERPQQRQIARALGARSLRVVARRIEARQRGADGIARQRRREHVRHGAGEAHERDRETRQALKVSRERLVDREAEHDPGDRDRRAQRDGHRLVRDAAEVDDAVAHGLERHALGQRREARPSRTARRPSSSPRRGRRDRAAPRPSPSRGSAG